MSYLRPLRRDGAWPERLLVLDCEARAPNLSDGLHRLRLGVAQLWVRGRSGDWVCASERVFRTGDELIAYISQCSITRSPIYVAAHNMAYDGQLLALPTLLAQAGWRTRRAVLTDHVWLHTLYKGRHRLIVFDTLQLLRASVAALGQRLGAPKMPMPDPDAPDDDWIAYCRHDVVIVARSIIAHIETLRGMGAGGLALTLAGQALLTYRRRYQDAPIPLSRDDDVMALEQASYHGGRVECYRLGEYNTSSYYLLDVNSMYPHIMASRPCPTACVSYRRDVSVDELRAALRERYVIADVTARMRDPAVPMVHDHRLVWPVGEYRTALHAPEIELALAHGEILAVHQLACYDQAILFRDYVEALYALKQKADITGDAQARHVAKLLLNSLYGKFGQWRIKQRLIPHPPGDDLPAPLWSRYTGVDDAGRQHPITVTPDGLLIEHRAGPTAHTHWGIAGAITAWARRLLWEYIMLAGRDHVLYTDTDSLMVDQAGYERLAAHVDEHTLGRLKLEQTSDHVVIRGPKDYTFGSAVKIKGVPRSSRQLSADSYQYTQFRGILGWQRDGAQPGVVVRPTTKTLRREYTKGVLLADGRVVPLRLGETAPQLGQT